MESYPKGSDALSRPPREHHAEAAPESEDLWVCLRRMGIPSSQQLDYPHSENAAEMVSKRMFPGWPEAMERLKTLQCEAEQLGKSQEV